MYIKKYWGNFIGGSDDSLNLVSFLEDQKMEMRTIPSSPSMMKRTGPGTHPDRVRFFAKTFVR